jgi:hypothetical protein
MGALIMNPLGKFGKIHLSGGLSGRIGRVFHPEGGFTPIAAGAVLTQLIASLKGRGAEILVTGGGFIRIDSPSKVWDNLPQLTELVKDCATNVLTRIPGPDLDLSFGVDVVRGRCRVPGQFGVFIRRGSNVPQVVWKSYPVLKEDISLPGFGTPLGANSPRFVDSSLGTVGLLVCHDAQVFNHRNQALVGRAHSSTPRQFVIECMNNQTRSAEPDVLLDMVHWVEREANTRSFRNSYRAAHEDLPTHPEVFAGFGYARSLVKPELNRAINAMKWPNVETTDVIVEWP